MKKSILTIAAATIAAYAFTSCKDDHGHDHGDDHSHGEESANHAHEGDAHDHPEGEGAESTGHADDHGHDHEKIVAGPSGGRILHDVDPHAEFFVTADRKVQITFVDDDLKPIAPAGQTVSAMAGDRAAPTRLVFAPVGDTLLSDRPLPEGNDFPIVVSFKTDADAETIRAKFNVNLEDCPTCEYQEYACTCDHGEHGHDHAE